MKLVLVGGFLGAGKTTLLWSAARRLLEDDLQVGLVTNDQADGLVDTALLSQQGFAVREVTGSCFCCNFHGLVDAVQELLDDVNPDIILAEPVGSCADVSATVVRPLKAGYGADFTVCPFTVLADPARLRELAEGREAAFHPDAAYIFRKQLEEADHIALNKVDELDGTTAERLRGQLRERFPSRPVHWISALQGEGVGLWLDAVLSGGEAGGQPLDIDYERYAEGERRMGWLNAVVELATDEGPLRWDEYCRKLLERLQERWREGGHAVGHVKLLLSDGQGHCVGNITGRRAAISLESSLKGSASEASMTLNARVQEPPDGLEATVRQALEETGAANVTHALRELECFRPARPEPTYRL